MSKREQIHPIFTTVLPILIGGLCLWGAGSVILDHSPDEFGMTGSSNDGWAYLWMAIAGAIIETAVVIAIRRARKK